ncbi:hypothetical protein LRP88_05440 [Fusarium phalaenopsidis]
MRERYRFDNYSEWIISKFGESRCFTGVFHAFPDASLCIQALMTTRRGVGGSIWTWIASDKLDIVQLQHALTGQEGRSHTCSWGFCISPIHFTTREDNSERIKCFQRAKERAERGRLVSKYCQAGHNPPCLIQLAATPVATKAILEYEALKNTIPQVLPRQVTATKGAPLLTEDLNVYKWEADIRVVDREVAMPEIEEGVTQSKPEELECSPSRSGKIVFDFMSSMD